MARMRAPWCYCRSMSVLMGWVIGCYLLEVALMTGLAKNYGCYLSIALT